MMKTKTLSLAAVDVVGKTILLVINFEQEYATICNKQTKTEWPDDTVNIINMMQTPINSSYRSEM